MRLVILALALMGACVPEHNPTFGAPCKKDGECDGGLKCLPFDGVDRCIQEGTEDGARDDPGEGEGDAAEGEGDVGEGEGEGDAGCTTDADCADGTFCNGTPHCNTADGTCSQVEQCNASAETCDEETKCCDGVLTSRCFDGPY